MYLRRDSVFIPFILLIVQIACWAEMDLFAPSLPLMMHDFGTTEQIIQLTLSLNFLGFFISSLFSGPLGDAYGRRPILLIGCALFAAGAVLTVVSDGIEIFLLGRFIQGVGVGAPAVLGVAVIGDLYTGEKQMRLFSLINSIITVTMALAPIVGVYIAQAFGWRANFALIVVLATLGLVVIALLLPETLQEEHKRRFHISDLFYNYKRLFLTRDFLQPALGLCFFITPYFVFIGTIPLIFIDELKMPLSQYVYFQACVVGVFSLLSLLTPIIGKRFNMQLLNFRSGFLVLIGGVLLMLHGIFLPDMPISITALMCIYIAGIVVPCVMIFVAALEVYPELRGSASALLQALRMGMLALGMSISGATYNGRYQPLGILTGVCVILGFIFLYRYLKPKAGSKKVDISGGLH